MSEVTFKTGAPDINAVEVKDPKTTSTEKVQSTKFSSQAPLYKNAPNKVYAGNVKGSQSGILIGDSEYDEGMPLQALGNIDEYRASKQSFGKAFVNGLASRTASIIPKIGAGIGYVGGAFGALVTGDIDNMVNNELADSMEQLDENLRESLPVYGSADYNSDGFFNSVFTQKFWFDDAFDGLAFMASAAVPAGAFGKIGKGLSLLTKGLKAIKGVNIGTLAATTLYNTVSESGFEANDTKQTTFKKLQEELNIDGSRKYTDEQANNLASTAAKNTFLANFGVLMLPNLIQSKFFLGGFKKNVNGVRKGIKDNIGDLAALKTSPLKGAAQMAGVGVLSEGIWEENIQKAIQDYEMNIGSNNGRSGFEDGYMQNWVDNFSTTEGQKAMLLGAIIGAPMGGVSGFHSTVADNKFIDDFGANWKDNIKPKLDKAATLFKDRINKVYDEDLNFDTEKVAKSVYQAEFEKSLFDEAMAAATNNDEFRYKFNSDMAIARYMHEFLGDDQTFETTDEAFEYALERIDELGKLEDTDTETFDGFKATAKKIKDIFEEVQNASTRFDNKITDAAEREVSNDLKKALFYEAIKRSSLEEMKATIDESQLESIDKLIADSKEVTSFLLDKTEREKLAKDYKSVNKSNAQRYVNRIKINTLKQEIETGKDAKTSEALTEEQVKAKAIESRELAYNIAEDILINGSGKLGPLDILKTEEQRESHQLGLRDEGYFQAGMSYKKKSARDSAYNRYIKGEATANEVYDAIANNTNENAPYNREDKAVLKAIFSDLRDSANELAEDRNYMSSWKDDINKIENEGVPVEDTYLETEDNYKTAVEKINRFEEVNSLLPKVGALLDNAKFQSLGDNLSRTEEKLTDQAANNYLDNATDPIISAFNSNKDMFSNINGIDNALTALEVIEAGMNSESRKEFLESKQGQAIIGRISSLRDTLNSMLKVATENNNSKAAADELSKYNYGLTSSVALQNQAVIDIIDKYLKDNSAISAFNNMKEDNMNFIHIEKLVNDIKNLPEEDRKIVIETIRAEKDSLAKDFLVYLKDLVSNNSLYKDLATNKLSQKAHQRAVDSIVDRAKDYGLNPSSSFISIIDDIAKAYNDGITRPLDIFIQNNNISEFYNNLKSWKKDDKSSSERLSTEQLLDLVEKHLAVESIERMLDSLDSTMDTKAYLDNEKANSELEKKADTKLAPSRQQRIAIFELLRWLGLKNSSNGLGAFAYLKGLAGTGKTTIVAKLFLKFSGVKTENIIAVGNNDSSTKTINDSLNTNGEKNAYTIEKSDITDSTELLFIDEIGAIDRFRFETLHQMVGEINKDRAERGVKELKVIAIGDPSQIVDDNSYGGVPPIQESRNGKVRVVKVITPLTVPYRSDISAVLEIQDIYLMNASQVSGITVSASDQLGVASKGVHAGTTQEALLNQLKVHNGNGRSKVLVVTNDEEVAKYKKILGDSIEGLDILSYRDVQGKTYEDVFIDINPLLHQVTDGMTEVVKRDNIKKRNKVMYTATSRATAYIYINDTTGTFKNKVSETINVSEDTNKQQKEDYQKQYTADVLKDIAIMKDGKVPPVKDKKDDEDTEDDTEVETEEAIVENDTDNDVPIDDIPIVTEEKVTDDDYEAPSSDIHNVTHVTKQVKVSDEGEISVPYKKGDTVFYIKVERGNKSYIEMYVSKDPNKESYLQIGVIDEVEFKELFNKDLNTVLSDDSIPSIDFKRGGVPHITMKSGKGAKAIIATGKVNATPRPLTYVYSKAADKSKNIFNNIIKMFSKTFGTRKFTIGKAEIKIYNQGGAGKLNLGGVEAGRPYLIIELTKDVKDKSGTKILQYVKLSPRKISKTKDGALIEPILSFVSNMETLESILKDIDNGIYKWGTKPFNDLILKLKNNYKVSDDGKSIVDATSGRLTLQEAQVIIPKLTLTQFNEFVEKVGPVIKGFYGIGTKSVTMTESEFQTKYIDTGVKKVVDDDTYYVDETGIYHKLEKDGKVLTMQEWEKKNGSIVLIPVQVPGKKYSKKYLTENSLIAGNGDAQLALNKLAKNNANPNDVIIRVNKLYKTKDNKQAYNYITGKSLLTSEVNRHSYVKFLRDTYKANSKNEMPDVNVDSTEGMLQMENLLVDENILSVDELLNNRNVINPIANPLSVETMNTALGFEKDSDTSNSLFLPLDMTNAAGTGINDLGSDIDKNIEELSDKLESHLSSILPSAVQVKIDRKSVKKKPVPKPEQDTSKKETLKEKAARKRRELEERGRTAEKREFESDKEKRTFFGDFKSKEEIVELIKKRIPGIKDEEIQFVKSVAEVIDGPESYGAYMNAVDEFSKGIIYIEETEDGTYSENVVKHEIFHKIYEERFSPVERIRIRKAFAGEFPNAGVNAMSNTQFEEYVAEKYQEWHRGTYLPKNKIIQKIFATLRDLFRFVATNGYYIESVFTDISEGLYKTHGLRTRGAAREELRAVFPTTGMLKKAKGELMATVSDIDKNGVDGYPVSKGELKNQAKANFNIKMKEYLDDLSEYAEALASGEDLGEEIREMEEILKMYTISYKNFDELFSLAYPAWDVMDFGDVEEILDETVNISEDIRDWDEVSLEGKVSAAAKQFMSDIRYKEGAGGYVNARYAYVSALQIMDGIQEYGDNFSAQLDEAIDRETSLQYRAVGDAISELYSTVKNNTSQGREVNSSGRFFKDGTFVYLTDVEDKTDLHKSQGIESLTSSGVKFTVITKSDSIQTKRFIEKIIADTNGRYTKQELFDMFSLYKNKDLFRTMGSNFLSQRERDVKVVKIVTNNGTKRFAFIGAKGRIATSGVKNQVKSALLNIQNVSNFKDLKSFLQGRIGTVKNNKDKAKLIEDFLSKIGLTSLIGDGIPINTLTKTVYNALEFNFIKSPTLENAFKQNENKVDDDDLSTAEQEAMANLDKEVSNIINRLLNDISKLIGNSIITQRATSVKAANGKKKYIHVLGNQGLTILNALKNNSVTDLFGGTTRAGYKKRALPKFLASEFFKHNIFKQGISIIYDVQDYDGATEAIGYRKDNYITEYKDEQYDNYMERNFSAQFLSALASSSLANPQYSQNLYTISNKPSNVSVGVSPLNREDIFNALNSMIKQVGAQKTFGINKVSERDLINLNLMGRAIERLYPKDIEKVYDKDNVFSKYTISQKLFAQLKDDKVVNKIAKEMHNEMLKEASALALDFIENDIMFPLDILNNENISKILDREQFKNINLSVLELKWVYDWDLQKSVNPTNKDGVPIASDDKVKFKETNSDVLERVNVYAKSIAENPKDFIEYDSIEDAKEDLGKDNRMFERQVLIPKEMIEPFLAAFFMNDYINSHQITQLASGPNMFFKNTNDLTKRLSGAFAPGVRGVVNDSFGMPKQTNIAILQDETFTGTGDIRSLLKEGFGLTDDQIKQMMHLFKTPSGTFEYSDAQGFMLPERLEEINNGFGLAYGAGNVMKPAYYHIDDNGVPRMLKYSSIVLTDELVDQFKPLSILRDKMRKGGIDGNTVYGEVVFASGNKVGQPSKFVDLDTLFNKDGKIEEDMGFIMYNQDYRLQLNPLHSVDSDVASPTQLGYFLNTMEKNNVRAKTIYDALSILIKDGIDDMSTRLETQKGLNDVLLSKLSNGETNRRTLELFSYFLRKDKIKSPQNYPAIAEKISTQLASHISKNTVEIRFPGAKLVLQTALGTEELKRDEELIRRGAKLNYKIEEKDGVEGKDKTVLFAEVILPSGILPKEMEDEIKKNGSSNDFIYGDLLGFRLPSSELHSAVPLRVVGFYDSKGTNVIIAPKEIVSLHGSDYDVDALFVIKRAVDDNGNPYGYNKVDGVWLFDHDFINNKKPNSEGLLLDELPAEERALYLKNLITETFLETVSTIDNRERMASPITMIMIKNEIKRIFGMKPKSKQREPDSSNVRDRQLTHASSFEASTGTGIFANAIKALAYLQNSGADNKQPTITKSELLIKIINSRGTIVSLDTLISNKALWEDLDAFLNSAIDGVKEQDLPNLNMTKDNIKAYIALRGFGMSMENANELFAQDVVELANQKGRNSSKYLNTLFSELLKSKDLLDIDQPINIDDLISGIRSEFSLREIYNNYLDTGNMTKAERDFVKMQYGFYNNFNKALALGDKISKLSQFLNIIKQLPNTMSDTRKIINIKKSFIKEDGSLEPGFGIDITNIFNSLPHVKEAYRGVELIKKTFTEKFYRYNSKIQNTTNSIYHVVPVEFDGKTPEEKAQRKVDEFIKFLLNTVDWDPEYDGFSEEPSRTTRKGVVINNAEAFNDRIFEMLKLLKTSDFTKSNLFISSISEGRGLNAVRQIDFAAGANTDYMDIIDFENAFEELKFYEVANGKIVERKTLGNPKDTLGYSKIQKDLMRYLIHSEGLIYSKNNYAEVLPLRLSDLFQRQYEKMMDSLLFSKDRLKSLSNLFKTQLAVNYPEKLQSVSKTKKIPINEGSEFTEFVTDEEGRYSDFSVHAIKTADGQVDYVSSLKEYPEFVTSRFQPKDNSRAYNKIYIRTDFQKGDPIIHYQLVARNSLSRTYSIGNTKNDIRYNLAEAFRTDIRNIQVRNPKEGLDLTERTVRKGSIISLTSYSDPARQNKYYYKVEDVKKVGKKNKYTLKAVDDNAIPYEVENRNEELRLGVELERIIEENPKLKSIAEILFKKKAILKNKIRRNDNLDSDGLTENQFYNNSDLMSIETFYNKSKIQENTPDYLDQVIIHEEIHRYTWPILRFGENIGYKQMKEAGFTDAEITFAKEIKAIHNQYLKNVKAAKDHPFTDIVEFMAYGLAHPPLIEQLKNMEVDNETILEKIINALVKLLGNTPSLHSVLTESFDNFIQLESSLSEVITTDVTGNLAKDYIDRIFAKVPTQKIKNITEEETLATIVRCGG